MQAVDLRVLGVEAWLYPSMYNAIHDGNLPARGDTLAEGIAVKSPGKITTEIVRSLVDDIALVNEAELERALATLISDREDGRRRRRRRRPRGDACPIRPALPARRLVWC